MANSNILLTLLLIIFMFYISAAQGIESLPAFASSSSDGICKSMVETQGYTCEEHKVTTKDGYILSLQRIPEGRSGKKADKPPVLLQHGLFVDAVSWLLSSPDESLAFILSDNGFDVWLGNTRGTRYSSAHTSLSPIDRAYWEWSWEELSSYDLHALVHYVYNHTGQKIYYTGHSQGTVIALAAFSQKELVNIIRSAALLSPIAHLNHIPSPLLQFAANAFLANALYWLNLREFLPRSQEAAQLLEVFCTVTGIDCSNILTLLTGPNCCFNSTTLEVLLFRDLQPTATMNLIHYSQMVRTGRIAKYDYGNPIQNNQHYGQSRPPVYDMTSIPNDLPLFLSYGKNDILSDVGGVQVLLDELKNHDQDKLMVVFNEDYAHADFILANNAKEVVYEPLMTFFNQN
ncbi:triacylglycerol lipase 2-like [Prosopis cineraria]|uniref:triacylglycerol lipase 2-like n=1 Tax=Prosopis cineraria TaxID=364024 RepID=UPI0024103C08|nr:triacylglycerol lipase 2-like [Prosopis cineraria]